MSAFDPVEFARALIRRPSVTPADEGALDLVEGALKPLGFETHRLRFEDPASPAINNLYARLGTMAPNFCFAGHTDVVPPGRAELWTKPPFGAVIADGFLWGRGSADMKGAIAAFIAAAARMKAGPISGSISLLITGDEEGPAVNGTKKVLGWLRERGETIDHCLVGEPTSAEKLGDMIKVGRRGSMNCRLVVAGRQGHAAYPERTINPVHAMVKMLGVLTAAPLDRGYERFQPSSLQATDIEVGNPTRNLIPARAEARFNIRFNPNWTAATLEAFLRTRLDAVAGETRTTYELEAIGSGDAFLTRDEDFLALIAAAITARTGRAPDYSTSGGTSDARFIKDAAPVADFGLVGATIHEIDERCTIADIHALTDIYAEVLRRYFGA